jgi:hypothetical protein
LSFRCYEEEAKDWNKNDSLHSILSFTLNIEKDFMIN